MTSSRHRERRDTKGRFEQGLGLPGHFLLFSVGFAEGLRWMTELIQAVKRLPDIGRPLFWPGLLLRRQREPELETAGAARVAGSPAVPRSVTCLEPFNAALCQDASRSGRTFVTDASLE